MIEKVVITIITIVNVVRITEYYFMGCVIIVIVNVVDIIIDCVVDVYHVQWVILYLLECRYLDHANVVIIDVKVVINS